MPVGHGVIEPNPRGRPRWRVSRPESGGYQPTTPSPLAHTGQRGQPASSDTAAAHLGGVPFRRLPDTGGRRRMRKWPFLILSHVNPCHYRGGPGITPAKSGHGVILGWCLPRDAFAMRNKRKHDGRAFRSPSGEAHCPKEPSEQDMGSRVQKRRKRPRQPTQTGVATVLPESPSPEDRCRALHYHAASSTSSMRICLPSACANRCTVSSVGFAF